MGGCLCFSRCVFGRREDGFGMLYWGETREMGISEDMTVACLALLAEDCSLWNKSGAVPLEFEELLMCSWTWKVGMKLHFWF